MMSLENQENVLTEAASAAIQQKVERMLPEPPESGRWGIVARGKIPAAVISYTGAELEHAKQVILAFYRDRLRDPLSDGELDEWIANYKALNGPDGLLKKNRGQRARERLVEGALIGVSFDI